MDTKRFTGFGTEQGVNREFRLRRPDGTIRHVRSMAHPVIGETGELTELVGTILDITERKKEEAVREQLRRRLIEAQGDERRRIALDMHDQFGQQLSALAMKLSALKRDRDRRTGFQAELAALEAMTRQLDTDLELIVLRLRPSALDHFELTAALAHYVKRWSDSAGVRPDVVVMDISMPGVNGLTATEMLKTEIPETKVLILTRHTDSSYVQQLLSSGASGYLLKQSRWLQDA